MHRLIYVSTASDGLVPEDIDAIVASSIRNNETRNITGVLIYNGLNFLQVLEGPRANVENIYSRIMMDTRHVSVTTVLSETAELRMFSGWHMAGRKTPELVGDPAFDRFSGVRDVMDRQMPTTVRKVLENFTALKGL